MSVIDVYALSKRYGRRTAVDGVTFSVAAGEIFGLVGPNGAGKTTTIECIAGLLRPDGGSVRVFGRDPATDRGLRLRVGVQLQHAALPDRLTVREAVALFASFYPEPAEPDPLLDEFGLADVAQTAFAKLSGGQRQRLSVALAMVGRPELAILDELTTGLDPQARRDTWELLRRLRERGTTIVVVTHSMEEAEQLCDRVALVRTGKLAALDTPAGLVRSIQSGQTVSFTPSAPLPREALLGLPGVASVDVHGSELTVRGSGDLAATVIAELCARQLTPLGLRLDRASLDDAYLALVGPALSTEESAA